MDARITEVDGKLRLEIIPKVASDSVLLNKFFGVYHRGPKLEYAAEDGKHVLKMVEYISPNYLLRNGWTVHYQNSEKFWKWNMVVWFNNGVQLYAVIENLEELQAEDLRTVDDLHAAMKVAKDDALITYVNLY